MLSTGSSSGSRGGHQRVCSRGSIQHTEDSETPWAGVDGRDEAVVLGGLSGGHYNFLNQTCLGLNKAEAGGTWESYLGEERKSMAGEIQTLHWGKTQDPITVLRRNPYSLPSHII